MSYCLRRLISPIAAMVAILAMGIATPARADLEVWLSETNNPPIGGNEVANDTTTPGSSPASRSTTTRVSAVTFTSA